MTRQTYIPDLGDYIAVRITPEQDRGCKGCIFHSMINVRCSAIPCQPHASRRWPVIYQVK